MLRKRSQSNQVRVQKVLRSSFGKQKNCPTSMNCLVLSITTSSCLKQRLTLQTATTKPMLSCCTRSMSPFQNNCLLTFQSKTQIRSLPIKAPSSSVTFSTDSRTTVFQDQQSQLFFKTKSNQFQRWKSPRNLIIKLASVWLLLLFRLLHPGLASHFAGMLSKSTSRTQTIGPTKRLVAMRFVES